ncbi:MAG: NADP(H)-dependent aldo-keto reductase [Candidatus Eutrophobiaceae bacterium]
MRYTQLGLTGVEVSQICLGSMTWGEQNTEPQAHEQLDYAFSRGINFIDTAEMYPVPPKEETQGRTDEYIGSWLARQQRDKVVLATKVAACANWIPWIREGKNVADAANIKRAVEDSLRRLRTDYIDLYQIHWPERATNYFGALGYTHDSEKDGVPIEETLCAFASLVQEGKIRYLGISNETPWGVAEYLRVAAARKFPRIVSIQNPYNLLNRTFEIGLAEFSHREQVGLLAYSPLAFGALSGKYLDGQRPPRARLTLFTHFQRYLSPLALECTEKYVCLAREHGLDPAQMALAYVNSRPFLTSNIIGATTMEQLKVDIDSIDVSLSEEVIKGIDAIQAKHPNPCP